MSNCSYCKHILKGVVTPHTRFECPYRRSMYCFMCACYGHAGTAQECPNKVAWALREGRSLKNIKNLEFKIQDHIPTIRTYLKKNYNIEAGQRAVDVYKALRDLTNSMEPPRMLVFSH